jgi:hypothetical protein
MPLVWGAREPRAEELALELGLPISAESGNLGRNKAAIRWMSVYAGGLFQEGILKLVRSDKSQGRRCFKADKIHVLDKRRPSKPDRTLVPTGSLLDGGK